jgi:hypothetical protein
MVGTVHLEHFPEIFCAFYEKFRALLREATTSPPLILSHPGSRSRVVFLASFWHGFVNSPWFYDFYLRV